MTNADGITTPSKHPERIWWIDCLRSFITLLVVAHHSSLAYTTFAHADKRAYILSTAPIVDHQRWVGLDIFENFNDIFFMALMFLIGGLFITKGLQKKGTGSFVRDRFYRLLLPFLVAVSSLMLLAYYPAYHVMHRDGGIRDFLFDFFKVEGWPPGPPWFIWVLFLFNLLLALFSKMGLPLIIEAGKKMQNLKDRPLLLLLLFVSIVWVLYVPLSWILGPYSWGAWGPFAFQKSRLLLYFAFFLMGSIIGSEDLNLGIFSLSARFERKWPLWTGGSLSFYGLLGLIEFKFTHGTGTYGFGTLVDKIIYSSTYCLSMCFSCLAFLTLFRRFVVRPGKIWISLGDNAYLIYLVHYIFVIWCQYGLLSIQAPAVIKFAITFIFSLAASWLVSSQLRRIPVIKKYV
jgi:glucan biosynthesis protein C